MRYKHLTQAQRFIIQEMLEKAQNQTTIAKHLGVNRSTISRELRRNSGCGGYNGKGAHQTMMTRRPTFWDYQRKIHGALEEKIIKLLRKAWSPEQISKRLKLERGISISHESIYRYLHFDQRSGGTAWKLLRRSRIGRKKYRKRFVIQNWRRKPIADRPIEANERSELGHWERDLVCDGHRKAALLTIVDRKSRFTKISRVHSFSSSHVNEVTAHLLQNLPCHSMTNDNGIEFSRPEELEVMLNSAVFYTTPYSSWERGTVENTNGLIRVFFPKGIAIHEIAEWKIRLAEEHLNDRPRRILNWKTPREVFFNIQTKVTV
jgi:IS30 family transposase